MAEPALVAGGADRWEAASTIEEVVVITVVALVRIITTIMVVGTIVASAIGLEVRITAMVVRSSVMGSQIAVITTIRAATSQSIRPSIATAFDRIAHIGLVAFAPRTLRRCIGPDCYDLARSQS